MSLDGFITDPNNPLGEGGTKTHEWLYRQKSFIEAQQLGGETGSDNDLLSRITDRIGANITGKRMFEEGEPNTGRKICSRVKHPTTIF